MHYQRIAKAEYLKALNSLYFLGCLTNKEFDIAYYNGSTALRAVRMPRIQSLWEMTHHNETIEQANARAARELADIPNQIRESRKRRGVCVKCSIKLNNYGCCPDGHHQ